MDIEQKINLLNIAKWGVPILALIVTSIIEYKIFREENKLAIQQNTENSKRSEKDKNEILTAINEQNDPAETVKEGLSFYMIISIKEIKESRQKYILDFGQDLMNDRVSVYLDNSNNLVFRIIDSGGENFTLLVPSTSYTFEPDKKFMLYCDCGISHNMSYLRMRLNDKIVGETRFQTKIGLLKNTFNESMKMNLGSDISNQNNGGFSISELIIWQRPLRSNDISMIWESVNEYYLSNEKKCKGSS